jgi:hypothetical protein
MPMQSQALIAGVAKQSAQGTIATNPTYAHGLSGGAPVSADPNQSPLDVTAGKRVQTNMFRESVVNGATIQSPAYIQSLGMYLLGALGTDTVSGTSPKTHTYSTGDLPYLSIFAKGVDATAGQTIQAVRDCKVDELSLKWDNSKPLELSVKLNGTVFSYPSTFTATTDDTGSESFLVPVGGTFQVDTISGTPVSARVVSGELTVKNNVSPIDPSASIEAIDVWEGVQEHMVKLTIVPDSLTEFRKTLTGSASGTAASSSVPVGSINLVFKENNGTNTLTVTAAKVAFLTSLPEADPKGGAIQIELAGVAVMPSGGTAPVVYALTNSVASY